MSESAPAPSVPYEDAVFIAMELGENVLRCGGEVSRAEDMVSRVCTAYGAVTVDVTAILSVIVLTVDFGGSAMGRCIYLGEDCAARQQVVYHAEKLVSMGVEAQEQLLSALFGAGYLEKEEIQVKTIRFNA